MVTRKSVPETASVDTNGPPHISIQGVRQELWSATDSEPDAERVWGSHDSAPADTSANGDCGDEVPDALRPGSSAKTPRYEQDEANPWDDTSRDATSLPAANESKSKLDDVPSPLRPGPSRSETNPFKRKPVQTSQAAQSIAVPAGVSSQPPTDELSRLQIREPEQNTNPWQPALDEKKSSDNLSSALPLSDQESGGNIWDSAGQSKQPSPGPASASPAVLPHQSTGDSQPWNDTPPKASLQSLPETSLEADEFLADQHVWGELESDKKKGKQAATQPQHSQLQSTSADGWNLIDHEPMPEPVPGTLSKRSTWENFIDGDDEESKDKPKEEAKEEPKEEAKENAAQVTVTTAGDPPALPPRNGSNTPASQPSGSQSQATAKSETYQIKNINWVDPSAAKNPRKSPILVQNANGPCPLVALVNALTLTTPADQTNSNLVETLRSREQISINFLLEAVFDELISSRRTKPDVPLPDMTELYNFLKGLHTGMNVNPRFIPTPEVVATYQQTSSLSHVHPSEHGDLIPGTFETTLDMKLYAAFSIPLIHGWLPPKDDPVYNSLSRQASSYDDAQSLLFREEELEDKLSNSETGLTEEEQQLYQDILLIKSFLFDTATQLTQWGLDIITKAIRPGAVAILFRNDHFSTLYRHPQTHKLFTLVTDAGYLTHDEVVWESLVDVRGERAEFFSGDFRLVSGLQGQRSDDAPDAWYDEAESSNNNNEGGWQTARNRRSRNNRQSNSDPPDQSFSPNHEQEDRDMALALQLQEEEEERHREEQAARRRESQLSEQFIEQQGRQGNRSGPRNRGGSVGRGGSSPLPSARSSSVSQPISVPPRTGSQARGGRPVQQVRSLIPPVTTTHRPTEDVDDAPPSYEQASKATPYVPPAGHPSHPESSPGSTAPRRAPAHPRQNSAGPSTPNRGRQGAPPVAAGNGGVQASGGKDRDCAVM
ncbi:hypothetical protein F5X99DRAFT_363968 [Biscogniauxia marginata]|nr:hypothetical protein F5X99DRAFT_363968 [Biscogniauxia marginata]